MNLLLLFVVTSTVKSALVTTDETLFEDESLYEDIHAHGYPEPLIRIDEENYSFMVEYDKISSIFSKKELVDRKIVVVSVVGALRKGKSFLLNYCLRYMYANVS